MQNPEFVMNLFKDYADAIRQGMVIQGYDIGHVQSDDHAAVMLFLKTKRYAILPQPRSIAKPDGFRCPSCQLEGLKGLENAISTGTDLRPYRSRKIESTEFLDGLLDHWNIHHFHLGRKTEADGFVNRTNELLFCLVEDDYVYFIAIMSHDSAPWAKKELITVLHKNWPRVLERCKVQGANSLYLNLQDEDYKKLRDAGIVTLLDMADGTIYIEPGIGRTSGGEHFLDLMDADKIKRTADHVQSKIESNWKSISTNARTLGYHFNGRVRLRLLRTVPFMYWDVIDPESGYLFRVYPD